jgi:hypothetical protein
MKRVALAAAVILAVCAPAAQGAKRATLTGRLTGARLPAKGKGRVPVWALRLRDGVVVASTDASAAGRFTLKTPAGSYAILAAVVPVHGAAARSSASPTS